MLLFLLELLKSVGLHQYKPRRFHELFAVTEHEMTAITTPPNPTPPHPLSRHGKALSEHLTEVVRMSTKIIASFWVALFSTQNELAAN
jgi:hypothetical protein